jgi:hypothetical protein
MVRLPIHNAYSDAAQGHSLTLILYQRVRIDAALNKSELGQLPEETVLAQDIQRNLTALSDLIQQGLQPAAEASDTSQDLLLVKRYREYSTTLRPF